jgi:hypothetical protein
MVQKTRRFDEQQIHALMMRILDSLQAQSVSSSDAYLTINSLYDMLIPQQDRKREYSGTFLFTRDRERFN